jgi:hypothetical protein
MIYTDLGGYHFLGGVRVRKISLRRLKRLIRTRYLVFRQSTPPLPTDRPQTCITALVVARDFDQSQSWHPQRYRREPIVGSFTLGVIKCSHATLCCDAK